MILIQQTAYRQTRPLPSFRNMPWLYVISTEGIFYPTGEFFEHGYSGHGAGLSNPAMQDVKGVGPLPVGQYTLGPLRDDWKLGKDVMDLIPFLSNVMYGRDLFRWHCDEVANPGQHLASDGCLISSRLSRLKVAHSEDHILKVIARPVGAQA